MDKPEPKETKGVPWADHNETESTPPDTRREEYGDEPGENADERAAEGTTERDDRESDSRDGDSAEKDSRNDILNEDYD